MKRPMVSICYHPTTVGLIDDDKKYADSLKSILNLKNISCKVFASSPTALDFLVNQYKADTFISRCLGEVDDLEVDRIVSTFKYDVIFHEIYRSHRFDEIGVLVIDYAMPKMNGLELCQQLRANGATFKIIMLTGEAGKDLAVEAFNEGIIDKFFLKDTDNLMDKLTDSIQQLQQSYFLDLSATVLNAVDAASNQMLVCLDDPVFIKLFNSLLDKNKITEYYLVDESGSYLFIDANGKLNWLIVKTEDQMEGMEFELTLDPYPIDDNLKKAIQNREVLRHCFNQAEFPSLEKPAGWPEIFYPATKLAGKANYYYSYIEKPKTKPLIDFKKIINFNEYRKKSKS